MLWESTGSKLLHKTDKFTAISDLWRGADCLRIGCLLCQMKLVTTKMLSPECNSITHGVSDQRLLTGGPRSYFQLIWTSFWTHENIIDQFILKGVNQWSCRRKKIGGILKIGQVIAIFLREKIFSKFLKKFQKIFFKLYMTIAQSIFKILRSSFLQTPPFW